MVMKPLLDFGSILPAFEDQYKNTTDRQNLETSITERNVTIEEKAARDAKVVRDQSRQSADMTRNQQLEILSGIEKELQKANKAISLSESQNPLDRMSLYMLQQTDPSYTRDGNIRRIEYYQKAADAVGGIETLKQAGYADQISQIQDDMTAAEMDGQGELTLLKMKEAQGEERIKVAADYMANMSGMIQNRQTMQEAALAQVPDEAVDVALEESKKTGSANVGGVDIPTSILQERKRQLDDRKFLLATRANEMQTITMSGMDAKMIDDAIQQATKNGGKYTAEDGTVIPLARLSERRAALTNQEYAQFMQAEGMRNVDSTRRREIDDKLLENFSTTELSKALAGDGKIDGIQFDRDQLEAKFNSKKQAEISNLPSQLLQLQGNLPERQNVEYDQFMSNLKVQPNTALSRAVVQGQSLNKATAAMMSDPSVNDDTKLALMQNIDMSRQQVEAAIKEQALQDAGGDKDIAILKEAAIRGTAVPTDVLETMITERATKGKSLAGILDPTLNKAFIETYNQQLQALEADPTAGGTFMDASQKKAFAVQAALEATRQQASGGITEQLLATQFSIPGNPLKDAGMDPSKFFSLAVGAEQTANRIYQTSARFSDEEMKLRVDGRKFDPELLKAQQTQMMLELEKIKPGLAERYMTWWTSSSRDQLNSQFIGAKSTTQQSSQDLAKWSLISSSVPDMTSKYATTLVDGYNNVFEVELKRQHNDFITFAGKPEAKQAFLIDNTPNLTDAEKKIAYAAITPLIQQAKDRGFNQEQTTQFVEGQLRTLQVGNPEGQKVIKKMIEGRDAALKVVDSFSKSQKQFESQAGLANPSWLYPLLGAPIDKKVGGYDWMAQ